MRCYAGSLDLSEVQEEICSANWVTHGRNIAELLTHKGKMRYSIHISSHFNYNDSKHLINHSPYVIEGGICIMRILWNLSLITLPMIVPVIELQGLVSAYEAAETV